jgi:hypothetical protein
MLKEDRYRELIAEQRESGLTIKEFCSNHAIARATFHYWKKKLTKVPRRSEFIPLVVKPSVMDVSEGPTLSFFPIILRGQKWSDFGLTFGRIRFKESARIFLLSLLVCILGLAGYMIGTLIMSNISGMPESADMSVYEYLNNNLLMLIVTLMGVYIISSFCKLPLISYACFSNLLNN